MKLPPTFAALLLLAPWAAAHAIRAADTPPPAPAAVIAANAKATAETASAKAVRQGAITALSASGDQLQIDGNWFHLADGQTRVYRQGKVASLSALAKGQRVSFSVSVAPEGARSLGVVYVQ